MEQNRWEDCAAVIRSVWQPHSGRDDIRKKYKGLAGFKKENHIVTLSILCNLQFLIESISAG